MPIQPLVFPPFGYLPMFPPYTNQMLSPYRLPEASLPQAPANPAPNALPAETSLAAAPVGEVVQTQQQQQQQQQNPQVIYMMQQPMNPQLGGLSSEELQIAAKMSQLGMYTVMNNVGGGAVQAVNPMAVNAEVGVLPAGVQKIQGTRATHLCSRARCKERLIKMKSIIVVVLFLGTVLCFPLDMYVEYDIHHAPVEAAAAIPAGVPAGSLEVLLPLNAPAGSPVRGFIKQDIPQPNGKDKEVVSATFCLAEAAQKSHHGLDGLQDSSSSCSSAPAPAPAAPAAPAPAAPAAPVAPVVVAAPVAPPPQWLQQLHLQNEVTKRRRKKKIKHQCQKQVHSIFHYLPHYTGSRQVPPSQVKNVFPGAPALPQTGVPGAYSVELIYPHTFGGTVAGGAAGQSFSTQGFIKYSIPQPPGRQSVEVYYPYDFAQQRIITNMPPMSNVPQSPNVLPFDFPPQNSPQSPNIPAFDVKPLPSQDPLQQAQRDQPVQTSQLRDVDVIEDITA
ncbi:hypothetical protein WMY93_005620 [Mugilogobius chulae]|uniref:Uncharacterized protein n=1 Tax=Mugilogobius chulae TaxID=88201 RepID=A0AAW0PHL8_9GOBI